MGSDPKGGAGSQGDTCQETVDERAPPRPQLSRGATIGRYLVVAQLGGGGMGEVYAAFDPELDRKVAIKLLRRRAKSEHARLRLQREAQAMARLSHPNVVPVYDVGTHGDEIFIAMELVDGVTITDWLTAAPRRAREIVRVFADAGRGLADAHAAGIIHRDFKPDNVLVDRQGRARVLDFGLARSANDHGSDETRPHERDSGRRNALDSPLTQAGTFLGTPAFMSLEQLQGRPADARSDQFSFCLALYRALYRERPFDGDAPAPLIESMTRNAVRPPPRGSRVPSRLRKPLLRGLRANPDERFVSMEALVAELERAAAPRRSGLWTATALLLALAGLVGYREVVQRDRVCRGAEAQLDGVWDEARRREIHTVFTQSGLGYAEDSFFAVARAFDDYARRWTAMRKSACEATRLRGEQSEELLDLRMQCLDQRLTELRVQTDRLARADGKTIDHAVQAADELSPIDACADAVALQRPMKPPADATVRARVRELREQLARAKALGDSGDDRQGRALADAAVAAARPLGYKPLTAEALLRAGILDSLGYNDDKLAAQQLTEAILFAKASRHAEVETAALTWMVFSDIGLHKRDEARAWARMAEAALEGLGGNVVLEAQLEKARGHLAYDEEKYDEALTHYRRELALEERSAGPESRAAAFVHINLGMSEAGVDRYDRSAAELERALSILEKVQGKASPDLAWPHDKLGWALERLGRYDEALPHIAEALAIRERTLGPDHLLTADSLSNRGLVALDLGRLTEAEAVTQRALAIEEKVLGDTDLIVSDSLDQLGQIALGEGQLDVAQARFRRALEVAEKLNGANSPSASGILTHLAQVASARGQWDAAAQLLVRALPIAVAQGAEGLDVAAVLTARGELLVRRSDGRRDPAAAQGDLARAAAIRERAFGKQHPLTARTLVALAEAELARNDAAAALAPAQRALAAVDGRLGDPSLQARARFVVAQALDGVDRDQACMLAREAHRLYAGIRARAREGLAVEAWAARRCH